MSTLYIDHKNMELRQGTGCINVYLNNKKQSSIPFSMLHRIVIYQQIQLNSLLLFNLAHQGIAITFLKQGKRKQAAVVLGNLHNDGRRRIRQYQLSETVGFQSQVALVLVRSKLNFQLKLLYRMQKYRLDLRFKVTKAIKQIEKSRDQLKHTNSYENNYLLGIEGASAAAYFNAYCSLFAESLSFTSRQRRPPPDPVNACLSLGYSLLHNEAIQISYASGLDPFIGFYHRLDYGRESLCCDLIEFLRWRIDQLIWYLFRERLLTPEMFSSVNGGIQLNKKGRQIFFSHYESAAKKYRRILRLLCFRLIRAMETYRQESNDKGMRNK